MHFPDDENGDVLRRMQSSGDDLSRAREIDFTVVFPDEQSAGEFAAALLDERVKVEVKRADCAPGLPWDVLVQIFMVPDHGEITVMEATLAKRAALLGGRNDGWGCFEVSGG